MKRKLHSEFWSQLPWKQFRKNLFRLQKRVWKTTRARDWGKLKNLQKLILRSRSAQFLAVRQVTQLNQGRKTAGVDGKLALEFQQRFELVQSLAAHALTWQHQKLRLIPIPKKDGSKRILKVPTIADRAWQCLCPTRCATSLCARSAWVEKPCQSGAESIVRWLVGHRRE